MTILNMSRPCNRYICICAKGVILLVVSLIILAIYIIPPKVIDRSSVTQWYVYGKDADIEVELSKAAKQVNGTHVNGFPKIMHHEFELMGQKAIDPVWISARQSCIKNSPGFTHMLWNTTTLRQFLVEHYDWFVEAYDAYPYTIQRLAAGRYFILHYYGGIYIDMDIGCKKDISSVMASFPTDTQVVLRETQPSNDVSNSFMITKARHKLFTYAIEHLKQSRVDSSVPYISIIFSTGPRFFSNSYYTYLFTTKRKADSEETRPLHGIYVLVPKFFYLLFQDQHAGSWHRWDAGMIKLLYQFLPDFIVNRFV